MSAGVLPFFAPTDWYASVLADGTCKINTADVYRRQTVRNRCDIVGANGVQTLTVPVTLPETARGGRCPIREVVISDHGNWRHVHWQTLASAYGMSPFFDYYADDIRPFFEERKWKYLFDYNLDITVKMLELIGAEGIEVQLTDEAIAQPGQAIQVTTKQCSSPSVPVPVKPYYQTFQRRHGFIPGLSILDLLFNEGPEAIMKLLPKE